MATAFLSLLPVQQGKLSLSWTDITHFITHISTEQAHSQNNGCRILNMKAINIQLSGAFLSLPSQIREFSSYFFNEEIQSGCSATEDQILRSYSYPTQACIAMHKRSKEQRSSKRLRQFAGSHEPCVPPCFYQHSTKHGAAVEFLSYK